VRKGRARVNGAAYEGWNGLGARRGVRARLGGGSRGRERSAIHGPTALWALGAVAAGKVVAAVGTEAFADAAVPDPNPPDLSECQRGWACHQEHQKPEGHPSVEFAPADHLGAPWPGMNDVSEAPTLPRLAGGGEGLGSRHARPQVPTGRSGGPWRVRRHSPILDLVTQENQPKVAGSVQRFQDSCHDLPLPIPPPARESDISRA
jgi:hypothetical protein